MGKVLFTEANIIELKKNKYVIDVNETKIIYSNEFKMFFIEKYKEGHLPSWIFKEAGFDTKMLGSKRIERCASRWRVLSNDGEVRLSPDSKEIRLERNKKKKIVNRKIRLQQNKINKLKKEVELLKKVEAIERRRWRKNNKPLNSSSLCQMINDYVIENELTGLTRNILDALHIPKSTYYDWIKAKPIRERIKQSNDYYISLIKEVYEYKGFKKGSRTIRYLLRSKYGVYLSRKKVQKLMKEGNIYCPIRKANPYRRMWKNTAEDKISPNLLERRFKTGIKGQVLLTDITYIFYGTSRKLAYLSTVIDAESKEILTYSLKESLKMPIVLELLDDLEKVKLPPNSLIHSDQGLHYTNKAYRDKVTSLGLIQSMSRRGNCHDNSPQESFYGHLKDELDLKHTSAFEELKHLIDSYMEYYNYERPQATLNGRPPIQSDILKTTKNRKEHILVRI